MRPPPSNLLPFHSSSSFFSRPDLECRLAPGLEREIFQGFFPAARADPRSAMPTPAAHRQARRATCRTTVRSTYLGEVVVVVDERGAKGRRGEGEGRGGKRVAEPQMARRAFVRASVPLGVNQREKCKCMCCVYLQTKRSSTRFWKWRATGDGADGSHRCSAVNYAARREGMKENWAPMGATARGGGSDLH